MGLEDHYWVNVQNPSYFPVNIDPYGFSNIYLSLGSTTRLPPKWPTSAGHFSHCSLGFLLDSVLNHEVLVLMIRSFWWLTSIKITPKTWVISVLPPQKNTSQTNIPAAKMCFSSSLHQRIHPKKPNQPMVNWYPIITLLVAVESKASHNDNQPSMLGKVEKTTWVMDNHVWNYTPNETNIRMEKSTIWIKMYLLSKKDKCPLPTILLFWRVTFRDILGQSQVLGGFHGTFIFQTSKWPTDFQVAGSCSFQGGWNKNHLPKNQRKWKVSTTKF